MKKKYLLQYCVFGSAFLLSLTAYGTKFAPMSLSQRVNMANFIATAKIVKMECLDEDKKTVPAGKICTAPGSKNKISYSLEVQETLYYRPNILRTNKKKAPQKINFSFTAMSHWRVPEDLYKNREGKEMIFLLREDRDGNLAPIHEAFFQADLDFKDEIQKLIRKVN
jgi:hypothetical protein